MIKNKELTGIILSAGKVHESLYPIFGEINTGLIPVKSKPAILYILDQYKNIGIKDVFISVGYDKERLSEVILATHGKEINIHFVEVDYKKKPGLSLLKVINEITKQKTENEFYTNVLVTLADTIAFYDTEKVINQGTTVLVSNDFDITDYWCRLKVDEYGNVERFYEKNIKNDSNLALVGGYYLEKTEIFNELEENNYEISDLLKVYMEKGNEIKIAKVDKWFDTGHLSKYYRSKKELLSSRFFNSFKYDDMLGIVRKESSNVKKLRNEILWFESVPKELKALIPKILDYKLDGNVYVEMEYYGYPTLSELWIYGNLSENIWKSILDRLIYVLNLFRNFPGTVSEESYKDIYLEKTFSRIREIKFLNPAVKKLLDYDYIYINGKKNYGWSFFETKLEDLINDLYDEKDNNIIHGDLCFSNILFDLNNGIIRLIDPRGDWGNNIIYGDIKYDVAKLRHSIAGKYDFIVNDLFVYKLEEQNIELTFKLTNEIHENVSQLFDEYIDKYYDIKKIKLIEGLLFISMLPLHNDCFNRQIAMLSRGLEILNEIL
ncbi:MAG: sugar phosphate nucleotidyltransferase [bacterium]